MNLLGWSARRESAGIQKKHVEPSGFFPRCPRWVPKHVPANQAQLSPIGRHKPHLQKRPYWMACSRLAAAFSITAASFPSTLETVSIASSALLHCFCSIASRSAGTVFTP